MLFRSEKIGYPVMLKASAGGGGIGSIVAKVIAEGESRTELMDFAFPSKPVTHGSVAELDRLYGLSPEEIADKIKEKMKCQK